MSEVVRGVTVYDGTGSPGFAADVTITGGRIAAVEAAPASSGLALAPGFIDVHSHDDFAVLVHPGMDFKIRQGVTTDVVGNCGVGPAPLHTAGNMFVAALHPGRDVPPYDGHAGYLERVDEIGPALNVAVLAGHGTLRLSADADLGGMRRLLGEALEAGCVGLSTGLIYDPGRAATTAEVASLAAVMRGSGALYATHMRSEGAGLLDAVAEAIHIGDDAGVPVQISHHKASGSANWGKVRQSLALIDAARARGADVTADQYPYTAGSTSLVAVARDAAEGSGGIGDVDWSAVVVASCPSRPDCELRTVAAIAAELGVHPRAVAEGIPDAVVVLHSMCEDDVTTVMRHPSTMIGSDGIPSDSGKPHPRLYGTFPRVLGRYARDLGVLSLEEAVHRMTGLPAAKFGLAGRGVIAAGAAADLVLFDPATVADTGTYEDPRRYPRGIAAVWVNGEAVVRDGHATGARPGRALRRSR